MVLWQVKHVAKVHWKHYTGSWIGDAGNFTNNIKITQHCFKTIHTKQIHMKLISSKTTHHFMSRFMSKISTFHTLFLLLHWLVLLGDCHHFCRSHAEIIAGSEKIKSPSRTIPMFVYSCLRINKGMVIVKHAWFISVHLPSSCYLWKVSVYQQSPNLLLVDKYKSYS